MDILETMKDTATDIVQTAKDYFVGETVTSRTKVMTTCTICTLTGIIIGFLFSPIKKGIYFNISNNGNYAPQKGRKTPEHVKKYHKKRGDRK